MSILNQESSIVLIIDVQEKLVNMLPDGEKIKNNALKLMKMAAILDIDTIITEQYPKGLGSTIEEIASIKNFKIIEKTSFSARSEEHTSELSH